MENGFSSINDVSLDYLKQVLELDRAGLLENEEKIIKHLKELNLLLRKQEEDLLNNQSFGDKLSDSIALFGGSWYFILCFIAVVVIWIIINIVNLIKPFDPYPFILLNLILSCLSALQAPIILMSQNRSAMRDRLEAKNDYVTNLKAELEIQLINAKLEQLTKK